jgi:hypothetical protein
MNGSCTHPHMHGLVKLIFNNVRIAQPISASCGCDLDCKEELFRSPVDRSRLSILQVLSDGAKTLWRDLTTEPVWKYEELPPLLLRQLTKLDLFEVGDTELARAIWFWCRRPKLIFHDSTAPIIVALCVLVSLFIALVNWPGTLMPKRVAEMVILPLGLVVEIYLVVQRLKFLRWRGEYERSIDRVIRTIQPGV